MDPGEYAAHGLYDVQVPDPGRLELLDFLVSQGVSPEEIAAAEHEGRLASVLTDRLAGPPCLTLSEVAARADQRPELVARVWRAAGFPDPEPSARLFSESDAEALAVFALGDQLFGEEAALQLVRVVGSSLARIAEAELSAALANVPGAFYPTATSPLDAMRTSATLLSLWPTVEHAIGQLLRRHLVTANRRLEQMRVSSSSSELRDLAVGFADLTGSTPLAVQLSWDEFARAMREFEALATDLVTAGGGRVVKLIGDEIMFVASDATAACRIALNLLDAFDEHPVLPGLRIGVTAGPIVARDGDYFGPVVHLASRLVDVAPPGTILVSDAVADSLDGSRQAVQPVGSRIIRGFAEPLKVFRLIGTAN
jgi:adenylate cyclase